MSKAVITALKRVMPDINVRREFVAECTRKNRNWHKEIDGLNLICLKNSLFVTFLFSKKGYNYWTRIFNELTWEELYLIINLKELEPPKLSKIRK